MVKLLDMTKRQLPEKFDAQNDMTVIDGYKNNSYDQPAGN